MVRLFRSLLALSPWCKNMMPSCIDMLGCGPSAGFPVQVTAVIHGVAEASVTYEAFAEPHEGWSIKPYRAPPITVLPSGSSRTSVVCLKSFG
jgi:hypothetical protein